MDCVLCRKQAMIKRLVGKQQEHRRIATRYDKLAASYLAFVQLAAIRTWLGEALLPTLRARRQRMSRRPKMKGRRLLSPRERRVGLSPRPPPLR